MPANRLRNLWQAFFLLFIFVFLVNFVTPVSKMVLAVEMPPNGSMSRKTQLTPSLKVVVCPFSPANIFGLSVSMICLAFTSILMALPPAIKSAPIPPFTLATRLSMAANLSLGAMAALALLITVFPICILGILQNETFHRLPLESNASPHPSGTMPGSCASKSIVLEQPVSNRKVAVLLPMRTSSKIRCPSNRMGIVSTKFFLVICMDSLRRAAQMVVALRRTINTDMLKNFLAI